MDLSPESVSVVIPPTVNVFVPAIVKLSFAPLSNVVERSPESVSVVVPPTVNVFVVSILS